MIVDASAVMAILTQEPEAELFSRLIATSLHRRISAATFVEVSIVVEARLGDAGVRTWDALFRRAELVIEPVTEEQAHIARQAWSDFGRGRHAAGLNFGDCFSYALSKVTGEPLLFKGDDFLKAGITSAL